MTGVDDFFSSAAKVFVGERDGAAEAASRVVGELSGGGLACDEVPCLQHEHVRVYHLGTLYSTQRDVDGLAQYACLRAEHGAAASPPAPPRMAPRSGRIELRDHRHAVETLSPLIGRRMRLATRAGRLAFGGWWLGSLDAGTFEVASDFGLLPQACGYDQVRVHSGHVVLEVWPTGEDGAKLDCVNGRPHTTMIHVPFGHDIALHLVDGARDRTDENLRGVFG